MTSDSALQIDLGRGGRRPRKAEMDSAFRASVEERLRSHELQLAEMRSRLNGLLFFIAGTVIAQVILRLVG